MLIRSALAKAVNASLTSGMTVTVGAVEARLVRVALLVVRREIARRQLLTQLQHAVERLAGMFGEPLPLGQLVDPQPLVEQKLQIAPREQGGLHRYSFASTDDEEHEMTNPTEKLDFSGVRW